MFYTITMLFTPQTINSALRSLKEQGLITLYLAPNSRKNKEFFFTFRGAGMGRAVDDHAETYRSAGRRDRQDDIKYV